LKCYSVLTWEDGEHLPQFHVLVEDEEDLEQFLDILKNSSSIDYFEVFDGDKMFIDGTTVNPVKRVVDIDVEDNTSTESKIRVETK